MKKFLILLVFCGMFVYSPLCWAATANCKPITCQESAYDVTEMLTEDGITGGDNNNKDGRFSSKNCYMCDTGGDNQCVYNDTVVILDNGGDFVGAWQCVDTSGVDDEWQKIEEPETKVTICGDSPLVNMEPALSNARDIEIRSGDGTRGTVSDEIEQSGRVRNLCRYRKCEDNYKPDASKKSCVKDSQEIICTNGGDRTHALALSCGKDETHTCTDYSGNKCVCGKCEKKTQETKKCETGDETIRSQSDCKTGTTFSCEEKDDKGNCICGACTQNVEDGGESGVVGKCHPSVCVSEVCKACCAKPSSETVWDRSAQVCQCMNGGKFTKENNQWICKVDSSQVAGPKEDCDPTLLAKVKDWVLQCSSYLEKPGADELVSELDRILEYCKGQNVKNDVFLRLYDDLKEMVDKVCVESTVAPQPVEDNNAALIIAMRKRITSAADVLDSIRSGFKVSVWKDEKGNFNTSRLVSDSVAGVVLGTAGGLITSNVVKKNQIEDGFEDIQCTVGGQVVSNWGDEFRVGIQ